MDSSADVLDVRVCLVIMSCLHACDKHVFFIRACKCLNIVVISIMTIRPMSLIKMKMISMKWARIVNDAVFTWRTGRYS